MVRVLFCVVVTNSVTFGLVWSLADIEIQASFLIFIRQNFFTPMSHGLISIIRVCVNPYLHSLLCVQKICYRPYRTKCLRTWTILNAVKWCLSQACSKHFTWRPSATKVRTIFPGGLILSEPVKQSLTDLSIKKFNWSKSVWIWSMLNALLFHWFYLARFFQILVLPTRRYIWIEKLLLASFIVESWTMRGQVPRIRKVTFSEESRSLKVHTLINHDVGKFWISVFIIYI